MSAREKKWVKVTACENVPAREGRCVEVAGRSIALFHAREGFLAIENRCPHRGGPLADGIVNGSTVVCPLHAWKFDLETGASINHPESGAELVTFPTQIQDGVVCVELPHQRQPEEMASAASEPRDLPLRWVQRKPLPLLRVEHPTIAEGRNS